MKFSLKVILVSAIILIAVIPAAYGNGWISVGGGAVQINDATYIDQTDTYTDTVTGNHVDIKVIVNNGIDAYFNTPGIHKNEVNGDLLVGYYLSSGPADYIKCTQRAFNAAGETASASTEIKEGSLSDYEGWASAKTEGVSASQSFYEAGGGEISTGETAKSDLGKAVTSTAVFNGYIADYNGDAEAGYNEYSDSDSLMASRDISAAFTEKIELKNTVFQPDQSKASVTTVAKGSIENGPAVVFDYFGGSVVGGSTLPWLGPVSAGQGYYVIAGDEITINSAAFNSAGYKASVTTEVLNGAVGSWVDIFPTIFPTDFATLYPDTSLMAVTGSDAGPNWVEAENIKLTANAQISPKVKESASFDGPYEGIFGNMAGYYGDDGDLWAYTYPYD